MTIAARKGILFIGFILTLCIIFGIIASGGYLLSNPPMWMHVDPWSPMETAAAARKHLADSVDIEYFSLFLAPFFKLVFACIAGNRLRKLFRQTNSAEIFFFALFIFSLSIETVRLFQIMVILYLQPLGLGILVSRIVYFGRLLGLFSFFAAGLFALGSQKQKYSFFLIIVFFAAFSLSSVIPVDATILFPSLIYKIGLEHTIFFLFVIIEVATVLNFLVAAKTQHSACFGFMGLGAVFIWGGREILFHLQGSVLVPIGIAFMIGGMILFSKQAQKAYLWV